MQVTFGGVGSLVVLSPCFVACSWMIVAKCALHRRTLHILAREVLSVSLEPFRQETITAPANHCYEPLPALATPVSPSGHTAPARSPRSATSPISAPHRISHRRTREQSDPTSALCPTPPPRRHTFHLLPSPWLRGSCSRRLTRFRFDLPVRVPAALLTRYAGVQASIRRSCRV